ncbi:heme-binding protein [Chitinophaga niastensis]|uniref:Heme-binding protein n=1 Tax=Chitinophaga niastensis TaxID=536980 RepID=A0A2P8HHK8_CHINA|nr:heme-binding domain-containing protein [Chitinophaga niastensis]PSL45718.1 heme-binding protein [Chitinophaga niastensis]
MRKSSIVLLSLLVILVLAQFLRPARNKSSHDSPNDIARLHPMPEDVQTMLKTACYDCHSNNTRYPWYVNIQPVGWFMASHINNGKEELNFNEYGTYSPKRQRNKLKRMKEEITKGDMPLTSYTLIHTDAKLTTTQQETITNWIDSTLNKIDTTKSH